MHACTWMMHMHMCGLLGPVLWLCQCMLPKGIGTRPVVFPPGRKASGIRALALRRLNRDSRVASLLAGHTLLLQALVAMHAEHAQGHQHNRPRLHVRTLAAPEADLRLVLGGLGRLP